ncbi:MAG: PAS domain S-box protein [Deltaproteobacteria bacterium]|nr:PAS domain S-box protein [Deltaproteobacteria bacterium]
MEIATANERDSFDDQRHASDLWQLYEYKTRYSPLPLVVTEGPRHLVCYANDAFCNLAGKSSKELAGTPFYEAVPEGERRAVIALLDRVRTSRESENISPISAAPKNQNDRDGNRSWGYAVWTVLEEDDCPPGLMVQVEDVTDAARSQRRGTEFGEALMLQAVTKQELAEAADVVLKRVEQSLRETEHRAKNNLQMISSQLSLQLREYPGSVPSIEIAKVQMHIKTIAAMHDLMTFADTRQEGSASHSLKSLLQKLAPMWEEMIAGGELDWACDEFEMPIRQCTSLVIIINELICNSIKYKAHNITLRVKRSGVAGMLELKDDGVGFPKNFDLRKSERFGLRFVDTVARLELGGSLTCKNSPRGGASVKISFVVPAGDDIK